MFDAATCDCLHLRRCHGLDVVICDGVPMFNVSSCGCRHPLALFLSQVVTCWRSSLAPHATC